MKMQSNLAHRLLALTSLLLICAMLFTSCNMGGGQATEPSTPTETSKPTEDSKFTDNNQTETHVHEWSEWAVTLEPTCTAVGEQSRSCACGEKGEDTFTVDNVLGLHKTENGKCTVCELPESSEGLNYRLNTNGMSYTVTGIGTCTDTHIVIGIYNNMSVTAIGSGAFHAKSGFTDVTISNAVTSIGEFAFSSTDIKNITLSENISIIRKGSFATCFYLEEIVIPEGVTEIQQSAFNYCTKLASVTLPQSLTKIDGGAFKDCKLTNITIPKNVVEIGVVAFANCLLQNVTFENTEGWQCHSSDTSLALIGTGTPVEVKYLQDSATAAEYIRNNTGYYGWKRS